jgi:O-succinylbenzoate synthase
MKIKYSLYNLVGKKIIQSKKPHANRQGALLSVEFEDGSKGYADCHPWEELGDQSLKNQLDLLKSGKCTRLTARSIYFAKLDAKARLKGVNLLNANKAPKSHYLVTHLDASTKDEVKRAWDNGFTYFKFKLGDQLSTEENLVKEIVKLLPNAKIRLDFNAKIDYSQFISFLDRNDSIKNNIDFVEDPFDYDYARWKQVQETYHITLAADKFYKDAQGNPEAAKVLILKPAVHTLKPFDDTQKIIVTSYLDHPFGQMTAAYTAAKICNDPCGLLSHVAYEESPFASMIANQGPDVLPVDGSGFGFDELLKKQEFVAL